MAWAVVYVQLLDLVRLKLFEGEPSMFWREQAALENSLQLTWEFFFLKDEFSEAHKDMAWQL